MPGTFFFLTPIGLLVCVAVLVPALVALDLARRQRRASAVLGLGPPRLRPLVGRSVLAVAAVLVFGLAAGQPVLERTETRRARSASEVVFVVDVSRSMLASQGPHSQTRLARARAIVRDLRTSVADVPAGLSGLTDRVLPYLFPTLDDAAFGATLSRSVRLESPPPQQVATVATDFASLTALRRDGFFSRRADRRTCVFLTDAETRGGGVGDQDESLPSFGAMPPPGDPGPADQAVTLDGPIGCRLLVVRVGDGDERIYADGRLEAQYRPEPTAAATAEALARAVDGRVFGENDVRAARGALAAVARAGPTREIGVGTSAQPLAPALAGLGVALVLLWTVVSARGDLLRTVARH